MHLEGPPSPRKRFLERDRFAPSEQIVGQTDQLPIAFCHERVNGFIRIKNRAQVIIVTSSSKAVGPSRP